MDSEELLSRVKTYDLVLIGWVTAMAVRARRLPHWWRCLGSLIRSPGVAMVTKEARS